MCSESPFVCYKPPDPKTPRGGWGAVKGLHDWCGESVERRADLHDLDSFGRYIFHNWVGQYLKDTPNP